MSVETSKKILKVFGIVGIIAGILGIIGGILILAGGSLIGVAGTEATGDEAAALAATTGFAAAGGIIALIAGILALLRSIFSIRAANDTSKIMPAFVFAVIGLISNILQTISSIASRTNEVSTIISLAIGAVVFYAAWIIKKSRA